MSNIITRKALSRRTLLKGVGAMLPLPMLNLMTSPSVHASSNTNKTEAPLRFVSLFKPNGIHPGFWNINDGTTDDFELSKAMQPLSEHKDKLLILDNLGDQGFSTHQASAARFLSGNKANHINGSLDQIIAEKIGKECRVRSLELTTEGIFTAEPECSYISYSTSGEMLPRSTDPRLIFDKLFRSPLTNPKQRNLLVSVLEMVREDAKKFERKAGLEDKQVLDQYFTMVREAEMRINNTLSEDNNRFDTFKKPPLKTDFDQQINSMIDVLSLALWTDSTRVASYMLGSDNSRMIFDFLGVTKEHHNVSHFFRNQSASGNESLLKITQWHTEKFAYLLSKLASYQDQNGTLLDNTLVHFGAGMGHSDNHTVQRVPTILAGAKKHLKTGRYLRYSENQRFSNLHQTIGDVFDIKVDQFADATTSLSGWNGQSYNQYQEQIFERWVKNLNISKTEFEAQGRLVLSDKNDEGNIYYLVLNNQDKVRLAIPFRTVMDLNVNFYIGEAIRLKGQGQSKMGYVELTQLSMLTPLFVQESRAGTT